MTYVNTCKTIAAIKIINTSTQPLSLSVIVLERVVLVGASGGV